MSEGWLDSKVGGGGGNITDEGYLDRSALIDALLDKMEFHVNNISALCSKIVGVWDERILAKTTECIEEDWGLTSEIVGP